MLREENGELKFCPLSGNINGSFGLCAADKCVAYDVIPAEYTSDGKPVERCLIMMSPFYPVPCCGLVTESKADIATKLYKEDRGDE